MQETYTLNLESPSALANYQGLSGRNTCGYMRDERHSGKGPLQREMAEGVGFEPTVREAHSSFQDCRLSPLGHPSLGTVPLADLVEDLLFHKDRRLPLHGDGYGVTGAGIYLHYPVIVTPDHQLGVEGVVL